MMSESGMKRHFPILLALAALAIVSLACQLLGPKVSLENVRTAYDESGEDVTSTFAADDVFYAVLDLNNAPQDTLVKAVWTAVDVEDVDLGYEFQEHTFEVTEESFSDTIYFQLSNDDLWPAGLYRVDIYLNDTAVESLEFSVE